MLFDRTTEMVKELIRLEKRKIHTAIDATMGNGNDTLFLSEILEDNGKLYAFDIQECAIEQTKKRMAHLKELDITYIKDGHENMAKYVTSADLIMFNLGYLPKANHDVMTKMETTIEAIKSGLEILTSKGMLTLVSYYGHPGGMAEKEGVKRFTSQLDYKLFDVMELNSINKKNNPPIVTFIRKK